MASIWRYCYTLHTFHSIFFNILHLLLLLSSSSNVLYTTSSSTWFLASILPVLISAASQPCKTLCCSIGEYQSCAGNIDMFSLRYFVFFYVYVLLLQQILFLANLLSVSKNRFIIRTNKPCYYYCATAISEHQSTFSIQFVLVFHRCFVELGVA